MTLKMKTDHISKEPTDVVKAQLIAYNNRDIDSFIDLFHEDAMGFKLGEPEPVISNRLEIKNTYEKLFSRSPNLHSTLISRMALGNIVIDEEEIVGRQGQEKPVRLIMIYEVVKGKIKTFHLIK